MRFDRLPAAASAAVFACALMAQAPAPTSPPAPTPPAPPPSAPGPAAADPVVASVNGDAIHMSDVTSAAQTLPAEYRNMPGPTLFPMLIDQLVGQRALLLAARKQGLDRDPLVRQQIARAEEQTLENALISREVGPQVSEAAVHARYDRDIAGKTGDPEVHARHILVGSEDEANKIIADLKNGGDFAALAKQHSTDPGASNGGDLGYFKRGDMLPEFSDVAFGLKAGQVADKPAHTRYGWHVIQVLDVRQAPAPTFEQAHDELRQKMIQEGVQKVLADARAGVHIERFNPDGTPQRATDLAEPPPAPAGSAATALTPQPRR